MQIADGTKLGRYEIRSQIGAGGMGEVFLAEDAELERKVALKILPAEVAADAERIRRFVLEAKAASALNHPNILTIYEIGQAENSRFIATEYIEGETLRERLNNGSLTLGETLDIGVQIASALHAAHSAGIVHRDIKPENIMLRDSDGLVKILDFGIAKLSEKKPESIDAEAATAIKAESTNPGVIIGTANYMSPEQARGKAVDARSDIFSFGIVLYEMLSGKKAFAGETAMDTIGAILHKEPLPLNQSLPEVPPEIERIVSKTLKKDAGERYQSAKDLLVDLKNLQRRLDFQAELNRERETGRKGEEENVTKIQSSPLLHVSSSPHLNSIAVLPFTNMSADAENEYFCDGLAEELLNALAKIEDLRVAARTSAFSFKGKNAEASQIGKTLNVKTVLEGSVRRAGNRLRITVQLINAADGYHLWSERYDREMRDIFDVQDEITLAVVDALKVKLFGEEKAAVLKRHTDNTEAYELYLKGRYCFNKYAPEDILKGIEYFEKAIEIEPEYAPAYAGIGFCYGLLTYFGSVAAREIVPKWRALINKALEIDASLADAHLSLASIHFYYEWNSAAAERDYRRAIELNPDSPDAHWRYGHFLAARGRFDEAIGEGEKAVELDPLSLVVRLFMVRIYGLANRLDDSLEQARKMIEIEPNFPSAYLVLGGVYMQKGLHEEAVQAYRKTLALSGFVSPALSVLGAAYGVMGKRDEAYGLLNQLLEMRKSRYVAAFAVARVYAGLGENDKAFEWFEKAVEERNGEMVFLKGEAMASLFSGSVRQDPRFQDLIRRVELPMDETAQGKTTKEESEAQTAMFDVTAKDAARSEPPAVAGGFATAIKPPATAGGSDLSRNRRWLFIIVAIILLLAAIGIGGYWFYSNRSTKQIESIAVLPFENASGNADLDYLSDGVSESVIDRLSQLPQLKVIARSSSFRYRGQNLNLQEIANALGVQAIITGRVVPRGDSYQIRVELVDARENKQLWGETFNRKTSDVQILQTDISREIADNLRLRLSGTQTKQLASQGTTNPQAYELLLKGRFYLNKGAGSFRQAIEYFEQAVAADPNYALAYTDLAEGYNFGGCRGLDQKQCLIKREALARKALELEPNSADAHFALAEVKRDTWEWQEAEREYLRAIELNPNLPRAYRGYAHYLGLMGRHDESITYVRRAREFDPLSIIMNNAVGLRLLHARRYDEAIEAYRKTIELDKNSVTAHKGLGDAFAAKRMFRESVAEYQEAIKSRGGNNPNSEALLGAAYARGGERGRAEGILQKLKAQENKPNPQELSVLYDALERRDEAFAELEKAYAERNIDLPYIGVDPNYDNLRSDPRFADLLRRMNLPQ